MYNILEGEFVLKKIIFVVSWFINNIVRYLGNDMIDGFLCFCFFVFSVECVYIL